MHVRDPPGRFDPTDARHLKVHEDHVRMKAVRSPDCPFAILGLVGHLNTRFAIQQCSQPLPDNRVVIHQ